jgi:hypothetical protein
MLEADMVNYDSWYQEAFSAAENVGIHPVR